MYSLINMILVLISYWLPIKILHHACANNFMIAQVYLTYIL